MSINQKVLMTAQGENDPLFQSEMLLLFKSIRRFGGDLANSKLIANFVRSADPYIKQKFEDLDVEVRIIEPFDYRSGGPDNKIRMLDINDDDDYDILIILDCDMAVVRDFSSKINPDFLQAKPEDGELLTTEQWQDLFSYFNLELPPERFKTCIYEGEIVPYFNTAVLSIPKRYVKRIRDAWLDYMLKLFEFYGNNSELIAEHNRFFTNEVALSLALVKEKIPIKPFPLEMNFPTHYSIEHSFLPNDIMPYILHYHHRIDTNGLVLKTGYKMPDLSIDQVNEQLLMDSNASNKLKKGNSNISKNTRVLQKVVLSQQQVIREKERLVKAQNLYLQKSLKDVNTLQNININNQNTLQAIQSKLKQATQEIDTLQSINIGSQKQLEQKEMQIKAKEKELENLNTTINAIQQNNIAYKLLRPIKRKYIKIFYGDTQRKT